MRTTHLVSHAHCVGDGTLYVIDDQSGFDYRLFQSQGQTLQRLIVNGRVFYGVDTDMLERPLVSFDRGGFTGINFTVEGQEYGATFADSDMGVPGIMTNLVKGGPASFSGQNGTPLTMAPAATASSLKYRCLR